MGQTPSFLPSSEVLLFPPAHGSHAPSRNMSPSFPLPGMVPVSEGLGMLPQAQPVLRGLPTACTSPPAFLSLCLVCQHEDQVRQCLQKDTKLHFSRAEIAEAEACHSADCERCHSTESDFTERPESILAHLLNSSAALTSLVTILGLSFLLFKMEVLKPALQSHWMCCMQSASSECWGPSQQQQQQQLPCCSSSPTAASS